MCKSWCSKSKHYDEFPESNIPCQIVPPSIVWNTKISKPLVVRVGALAPAQSTVPGQVTVCEPPFVKNKIKELSSSDTVGFEKVKVVVPVSTVAVTEFPAVKSIASVPPPPPTALVNMP